MLTTALGKPTASAAGLEGVVDRRTMEETYMSLPPPQAGGPSQRFAVIRSWETGSNTYLKSHQTL